jgi:hypothetical protein
MAIVFTSLIYAIMYTPFLQIFLEVGSWLLQSKAALASVCKYIVHFRCLHLLHTRYVQIQNPSQQLEGWKSSTLE